MIGDVIATVSSEAEHLLRPASISGIIFLMDHRATDETLDSPRNAFAFRRPRKTQLPIPDRKRTRLEKRQDYVGQHCGMLFTVKFVCCIRLIDANSIHTGL